MKLLGETDAPILLTNVDSVLTFDASNYDHSEWALSTAVVEIRSSNEFDSNWHVATDFGLLEPTGNDKYIYHSASPWLNSEVRVAASYILLEDPSELAYSHFGFGSVTRPSVIPAPDNLHVTSYNPTTGELDVAWNSESNLTTGVYESSGEGDYPLIDVRPESSGDGWAKFASPDAYIIAANSVTDDPGAGISNYVALAGPGSFTTKPDGLSVIRTKDEKAEIHWHNNSDNETGFVLERSLYADFHDPKDIPRDADQTSYEDSDIDGKHSYHYRVKAINAAGDSSWSSTASIGHILVVILSGHLAHDPKNPALVEPGSGVINIKTALTDRKLPDDMIYMSSEDGPSHEIAEARVLKEIKSDIAIANMQGESLKIAMVGHSHGAGLIMDLSFIMAIDHLSRRIGNYDLFLTGYIDGVHLPGSAPETLRPIESDYHMNWYQSNVFLEIPLHGGPTNRDDFVHDFDVPKNTKTHTNIDDDFGIANSFADQVMDRKGW